MGLAVLARVVCSKGYIDILRNDCGLVGAAVLINEECRETTAL